MNATFSCIILIGLLLVATVVIPSNMLVKSKTGIFMIVVNLLRPDMMDATISEHLKRIIIIGLSIWYHHYNSMLILL